MKLLKPKIFHLEIIFVLLVIGVTGFQSYQIKQRTLVITEHRLTIQGLRDSLKILKNRNSSLEEAIHDYEGEVAVYGRLYELYKAGNVAEAKTLEKEIFSNF